MQEQVHEQQQNKHIMWFAAFFSRLTAFLIN